MDALTEIEKHAEKAGYTLTQLFTAAGVAYSNWGRWQRGETMPTLRVLNKLLAVKPTTKKQRAS